MSDRTRVAPDVLSILASVAECENPSGGPEYDPAVVRRAVRQLRALLEVSRAADRMTFRFGGGVKRKELDRALARLKRASGEKP